MRRYDYMMIVLTDINSLSLLGIHGILCLKETDLKRNLLASGMYDRTVRPRLNATETVHVQIGLVNIHIIGLNEKESSFSQAITMHVSWKDEFLTWNSSPYEDLESLVVDPSSIWTPDINIFGRIESNKELDLSRARVQSTGVVSTTFSGVLTTHCSMDSAYFPFDYQLCDFKIGSQVYTKSEVAIEIISVEMAEDYDRNPNWLMEYSQINNTCQEVYFCLQRRSLYLTILYMVPALMHSVLILVSYVIPSEAGEKISFGMSLFLSFMVFLLQLNGDLPEVSAYVPALEVVIMLHMLSGVVSVFISSVTAYLIQNPSQSQVTVTEVNDLSLDAERKDEKSKKKQIKCICAGLRSVKYLNRIGFVVSLILILMANLVMITARLVSTGCAKPL
ncbi:neuronal acetylcholine receptor subunit alpha-6-like [Saccostrea echinata]|uniref:neuronal acetylcholine receptor subunit alpha-6-like n=1 Tax=Saccostrea echinata TaxID=191078 RepID=UPI002A7F3311|nr:neuronal acetylcholine receptor subunit alpha-6-like [Saccostrea echinata]